MESDKCPYIFVGGLVVISGTLKNNKNLISGINYFGVIEKINTATESSTATCLVRVGLPSNSDIKEPGSISENLVTVDCDTVSSAIGCWARVLDICRTTTDIRLENTCGKISDFIVADGTVTIDLYHSESSNLKVESMRWWSLTPARSFEYLNRNNGFLTVKAIGTREDTIVCLKCSARHDGIGGKWQGRQYSEKLSDFCTLCCHFCGSSNTVAGDPSSIGLEQYKEWSMEANPLSSNPFELLSCEEEIPYKTTPVKKGDLVVLPCLYISPSKRLKQGPTYYFGHVEEIVENKDLTGTICEYLCQVTIKTFQDNLENDLTISPVEVPRDCVEKAIGSWCEVVKDGEFQNTCGLITGYNPDGLTPEVSITCYPPWKTTKQEIIIPVQHVIPTFSSKFATTRNVEFLKLEDVRYTVRDNTCCIMCGQVVKDVSRHLDGYSRYWSWNLDTCSLICVSCGYNTVVAGDPEEYGGIKKFSLWNREINPNGANPFFNKTSFDQLPTDTTDWALRNI